MLDLSNPVAYSGERALAQNPRYKPEETAACWGQTHAHHGQLEVIYNANYETCCGCINRYGVKDAQQLSNMHRL